MANQFLTMLDIMKMNTSDPMAGLIEDVIKANPELDLGAARTIPGTFIQLLARTNVPAGAGWRAANAGVQSQKSTYEPRRYELFMIQKPLTVDKQVADSCAEGPDGAITKEADGILEGSIQGICGQFYYGASSSLGDAGGTPGLIDMYDANNMVVDAGGTSANTGTSIWMVKWGPKDVQWLWGNNRTLGWTPLRSERVPDPNDSTKTFLAYVKELLGHAGVQVGRQKTVVRIKKITDDVGHTATDALMAKGLKLFPTGVQPDVIFMTRRANGHIQASRTPVNQQGTPAPFPREVVGMGGQNIPIVVTDSISDVEPLTL